jgi:hypothetical protein
MNNRKLAVLYATVLSMAAPALAQNEAPKPVSSQFYRFDFVLKELDGGKTVKTHNYQMLAGLIGGGTDSIRSGAKVPVVTPKEITYIDVGVNLDVRSLILTRSGLEFDIVAEVSGTLDPGALAQFTKQPLIYQTKWNSRVQLQVGKATTVFSSDDPSSKHQLQLEVTATPVN